MPSEALPGDLLFIYEKKKGVSRIERIKKTFHRPESQCAYQNLTTVETKLYKKFSVPLPFDKIKADKTLVQMKGVSRHFQGTTFPVTKDQSERLLSLLEKKHK